MNWEEVYKFAHKHFSQRDIEIGIKDWKQRSSILLYWLRKLKVSYKSKILDCGCGIGICCKILKENGYKKIIGIDIDKNKLDFAKQFCNVKRMNCENLNFPNKSFDVIIALNIIEHLRNPQKFLYEVKRILRTRGLLIISTPNTSLLRKLLGKTDLCPEHLHYWSYRKFIRLIKNNGFKVIDIKPIGRLPVLELCQTFMLVASLDIQKT